MSTRVANLYYFASDNVPNRVVDHKPLQPRMASGVFSRSASEVSIPPNWLFRLWMLASLVPCLLAQIGSRNAGSCSFDILIACSLDLVSDQNEIQLDEANGARSTASRRTAWQSFQRPVRVRERQG
ncbi:hypothetical protein [Bradyrhizobium sp. sGM-13]|uniref:hypothetical protein n=1 Tax=Bradyrhizobium sp. sGM-13 TaxID=2831781 RepID=UPI001BD1B839|nr:hypothetical protein [Bradyrhizobium sp. sGM-13]